MSDMKQTPMPGTHLLLHCGDVLEFRLENAEPIRGHVFLRTNLGNAYYHRKEIIEHVEGKSRRGFRTGPISPCRKMMILHTASGSCSRRKAILRENAL